MIPMSATTDGRCREQGAAPRAADSWHDRAEVMNMFRRLFKISGPFKPVDDSVQIRGATPPTVPMKRGDMPAAEPAEGSDRDRR